MRPQKKIKYLSKAQKFVKGDARKSDPEAKKFILKKKIFLFTSLATTPLKHIYVERVSSMTPERLFCTRKIFSTDIHFS